MAHNASDQVQENVIRQEIRFQSKLQTSPLSYLRAWRLHMAALALADTHRPIADIAYDAGYGSEAAFNRAFSKHYGKPPGAWRAR